MPYKPEANIRSEVLQDKLYLQTNQELEKQPLEALESLVEYWDLWLEAIAGKQVEDLLEARAYAEALILKKKRHIQAMHKYIQDLQQAEALDNIQTVDIKRISYDKSTQS